MKMATQHNTQSILFVVMGETAQELEVAHRILTDTEICTNIYLETNENAGEQSLITTLNKYPDYRMVVIVVPDNRLMLQDALALSTLAKERGLLTVVETPHCGRTLAEFLATEGLTKEMILNYTDCVLLTSASNIPGYFYRDVQCFQQYLTAMLDGNNFICLDFEDISSVLKESGFAYFGAASITGSDTAERKTRIEHMEILPRDILAKAKGVIMHIVGSYDIGLEEVEATAELIQPQTHPDVIIVFGAAFDDELRSEVQVSVLAAGISVENLPN